MLESCIYVILPHLICACKSTVEEKVVQENVNVDKSLNRQLNDAMTKHATDSSIRTIFIAVGIIIAFALLFYTCKHLGIKCKRSLMNGFENVPERRVVRYARRLSQIGTVRAAINRYEEREREDNVIPK